MVNRSAGQPVKIVELSAGCGWQSDDCPDNMRVMRTKRLVPVALLALAFIAGCGGGTEPTDDALLAAEEPTAAGVRLVSATQGAAIQAQPPEDLVILDVRTPEEFAEGHLDGAVLVDFYDADFAEQIGELDPNVPYLMYCRSGNRSGQTATIMEQLGFTDVADVDGGILSWADAGLPLVDG